MEGRGDRVEDVSIAFVNAMLNKYEHRKYANNDYVEPPYTPEPNPMLETGPYGEKLWAYDPKDGEWHFLL